ncbi:MAG TPA: VCBS repeat-containing protein [Terriglobales bacterium]|nr:VCBS repeat-containing protein [Terriglobales bacterium]
MPYITSGYKPYSVAIADVNGDAKLDLVVANELACVADALNQSSTGAVTVLINATKIAPHSAKTAGTVQ